ncbi:MAG TPA: hypothetical protein VGF94_18485 [Kofleriaceae bacterium]|jgi:hypothetical protein
MRAQLDPNASGITFTGRRGAPRWKPPAGYAPLPTSPPTKALLSSSWIVIWPDGTIRFECRVTLGQVFDDPLAKHEPVIHREHLQPDKAAALVTALERTSLFAPAAPNEPDHAPGADCGVTELQARSGSKHARLRHWGCDAKPTALYKDVIRVLSAFIDEAPCRLRCDLFGTDCKR